MFYENLKCGLTQNRVDGLVVTPMYIYLSIYTYANVFIFSTLLVQVSVFVEFFWWIWVTDCQIWVTDCVYFPSYSAKCISCFMLRHLMASWNSNIWKSKIWFSRERKELLKRNKIFFSLFHKCSPSYLKTN